jgi:signal transduction histidine kinase/CheY-like chemotaxis protein
LVHPITEAASMLRTLEDMFSAEVLKEFSQQIEAFRRKYLVRVLALLAGTAWATGMIVLLVNTSGRGVGTLLGFEAMCWLIYRLCLRNRLRWAQHLLVISLDLWLLGLVWLVPDPALLFLPVLAAPLGVAVLEMGPAAIYTGLLVIGQLFSAYHLFPEAWFRWQTFLAPFLTIEATALAMIWGANLYTALGWAVHSTRSAVERLEEVQEHRAQLHQSMEELDAVCKRLERMNEMLLLARAEAEAARQARNQFALTVSHELRTPLSFIIGFSELMVNSPGVYAELSHWPSGLYDDIQEIYHNSNHLMRLVNDILELGQGEARRLMLTKEWTPPAGVVQEAEVIMRAAIANRHLYLRVEVEPNLPELFMDRTRIRQVLINLLGNSLRFTEEGGITLRVRRRATEVLFCVQDTGVGIPADEIPKVFEDFGQANTTVWRRRGGSGLGVPISRRFVEMHGGHMWLESEVGRGTSFYFALPMPGAAGESSDWSLTEEDGAAPLWREQASSSKLVLVLSPEPNADQLIEAYLNGYRVLAASQADLAAQQVANLLPHALIIDQAVVTDPEVAGLIQALPYDLPVVVFSLPGSSAQPRALPPGVRGHLVKPVCREDLVSAIQNLAVEVRSLLIIDDDPAMVRFVSLALAASKGALPAGGGPIRLASALTGQEALDQLSRHNNGRQSEQPDAILLDLKLPDIDGWDLLGALQATPEWRDIPVILVTAADLRQEMDLRERKVLQVSTSRPLSAEELGNVLQALLGSLQPMYPANAAVPELSKDLSA